MPFHDVSRLLHPGDLLVRNVTRVLPARLLGTRPPAGGTGELLLLEPCADGTWWALARPARRLRVGSVLRVAPDVDVEIVEAASDGQRRVRFPDGTTALEVAQRCGHMPLPPYIRRPASTADRRDYQTVYARIDGSIAAPTAGLHFTETLLQHLQQNGVRMADIVLHVGIGTFEPIRSEDPLQHSMHRESIEIPVDLAQELQRTRDAGGRIVAVGTTVVRVLESLGLWLDDADDARVDLQRSDGVLVGSTALFVHPPHRFRFVDALITNFHLPRSSLLLLVGAFAGMQRLQRAYAHAIEQRFRFFSYGDATFWEKPQGESTHAK
jgi:S-adenosylmethionine:tRNA ribosyltransferase-isomerase